MKELLILQALFFFLERQSSVYASHYLPLFSQPPPCSGSTSGRDSLESKVTFIQLSE